MRRGNRLRAVVVALATLTALSIAGFTAGSASAASAAQHASSAAQPGTPVTGSVERVQKIPLHLSASPNYAVTCYAFISTPYETGTASTGYQMNAVGSTTCSPAVTYLRMSVYVYWNGNPFGYGGATGTSYVTATASGPCLAGSWFGELDLEIIWPAGVTGPPTYSTRSNTTSFDIC